MDFEIIYPTIKKHSIAMLYVRYIFGIIFLAASVICTVVNIILGGVAWSVIAMWGMLMVWKLVLKTPLVERNLISQGVKLAVMTVILLILIDRLIYPGWAAFVVPIVGYAALIVLAILFFVNVSKQRHNVMPLIILTTLVVVGSTIALFVLSERSWPMIVLAVTAAVLLVATVFTLKTRLISELVKRFHIK